MYLLGGNVIMFQVRIFEFVSFGIFPCLVDDFELDPFLSFFDRKPIVGFPRHRIVLKGMELIFVTFPCLASWRVLSASYSGSVSKGIKSFMGFFPSRKCDWWLIVLLLFNIPNSSIGGVLTFPQKADCLVFVFRCNYLEMLWWYFWIYFLVGPFDIVLGTILSNLGSWRFVMVSDVTIEKLPFP